MNHDADNWKHALGVRSDTLSDAERVSLDEQGFVNLGILLNHTQRRTVIQKLTALMIEEGENAGAELLESPSIRHPRESGVDRLADLVNKSDLFDTFYTHPRVLAAVFHVLGERFKLSSLNYRCARPGDGHQRLHVDWPDAVVPGDFRVCNSIWLLDEFTASNGATRLVPGSHRSKLTPEQALPDPQAEHSQQILVEAPAGSVFVFNSHVWHGGTQNNSAQPRRAIHSYFCRADEIQQIDQQRYLRSETRKRLNPATLRLLGIADSVEDID